MTISYRVQSERSTNLSATALYITSGAKALGNGVLSCFSKPRFDPTRLSPHMRQDAGIDEQTVLQETTKNAMLIR